MEVSTRIEHDLIGSKIIHTDAYYGIQNSIQKGGRVC